MLRSFLTWFSLVIMATALAACCGSTACECDDAYADAISLQFDTVGTATSPAFVPAELETVYLVRVPRDTAQRPRADTVQLKRTTARATQPIIINNTTPFAQAGNRKLDRYSYYLYLAPARFNAPHSFDFAIDTVKLQTNFRAEGCCTCFENVRKQVYTNGSLVPTADLADPDRKNALIPLPVKRQP
ncbi:hypothetical protein [Hymenobacter aerophilus]|uniref:hypothetical protein n=1 Tax=Hymenobacter aerophilus TaxID=119644 RepID=UPI00036B9AD6|nr:hypothetical protein [Hymenobacter aerophilus]